MKRTTATMPSKAKILEYWKKESPDMFYKNMEWSLHDDNEYDDAVNFLGKNPNKLYCCFACGFSKTIERAHIIPVSSGGSDDVSNIHLLCHSCHLQTEGMAVFMGDIGLRIYNEWIMKKEHYRAHRDRCVMSATESMAKELTPDEMQEMIDEITSKYT